MTVTAYLRVRRGSSKYAKPPAPVLTVKKPTPGSVKSSEVIIELKFDIPDSYFDPMPMLKAEVKVPPALHGDPAVNAEILNEIEKRFTEETGLKIKITKDGS